MPEIIGMPPVMAGPSIVFEPYLGCRTCAHPALRHRPLEVLLDDPLDVLVAAAAAGAGAGGP
jgi:hypothetical protein